MRASQVDPRQASARASGVLRTLVTVTKDTISSLLSFACKVSSVSRLILSQASPSQLGLASSHLVNITLQILPTRGADSMTFALRFLQTKQLRQVRKHQATKMKSAAAPPASFKAGPSSGHPSRGTRRLGQAKEPRGATEKQHGRRKDAIDVLPERHLEWQCLSIPTKQHYRHPDGPHAARESGDPVPQKGRPPGATTAQRTTALRALRATTTKTAAAVPAAAAS